MPVPGSKPKPQGQARHRVKSPVDWAEVADVPFAGAPKLPAKRPNGLAWPAWTKAWWAAISTMPHCALWGPSEWRFAVETALVAAQFHGGKLAAATELRNREKVLGTTLDYRRDLRIRYVQPAEVKAEAGEVTRLDDYRELYD